MIEFLLALLLNAPDRHGEAGIITRYTASQVAQPMLYTYLTSERGELGVGNAIGITLRSEDAQRFGLTPMVGMVAYTGPVPSEGRPNNFMLGVRAEYQVAERLSIIGEGRHVSSGKKLAFLDRSGDNPGLDQWLLGVAWRF